MAASETYKRKLKLHQQDPEKYPIPAHWPPGVLWFSLDDDVFGFDENNNLYVDGKKVQFERRFTLTIYQGILAFIAAASSAVVATVEFLSYLSTCI